MNTTTRDAAYKAWLASDDKLAMMPFIQWLDIKQDAGLYWEAGL